MSDLNSGAASASRVASRYLTAVRKLWWHGTATANLRSILSQGLVPKGTKAVFDEEVGQAGNRSIKTFGGAYLTDNWMTAFQAGTGSTHKLRGVRSGPVRTKVMVGVTYESRSPGVMADEDDVIPLAERVVGRTTDDLVRSIWMKHLPRDWRAGWGVEGTVSPKVYGAIGEMIEAADISEGVAAFIGLALKKWPKSARGYKVRKPQVDAAVERLLRALTAHLIENEIKTYGPKNIASLEESLDGIAGDSYIKTPEEAERARLRYEAQLQNLRNPPAVLTATWGALRDATDSVSKLIPEMAGPKDGLLQLRHNIRTPSPITYRGKNRIIMVVEILTPKGVGGATLRFHYGLKHWREFVKSYEKSMGLTWRVTDKGGQTEAYNLRSGDEWPEYWGPAPSSSGKVAASIVGSEQDFVGFHCQRREHRGRYEGTIDKGYATTWFSQVIQALPYKMQDQIAEGIGRDNSDIPSEYDDDFDEWAGKVEDWLYDHNINWIFVSEDRPLTNFGDWCYRVYMPAGKILGEAEDYGVEGQARVYLYDKTKVRPKLIEVDDEA